MIGDSLPFSLASAVHPRDDHRYGAYRLPDPLYNRKMSNANARPAERYSGRIQADEQKGLTQQPISIDGTPARLVTLTSMISVTKF